jgi:hypothetical protein
MGKYCKHGEKRSGWEKLICRYLCEKRIVHCHQPYKAKLFLENERMITYQPDILIGNIIIEPHGSIGSQFIEKMTAFRKVYSDSKVILVARNIDIPNIPEGVYDEAIPIEHLDMLRSTIMNLRIPKKSS